MSTATTNSHQTGPAYLATVPPQEILPVVNDRYESSVAGIYVIGDVTGQPLVKIAANQGAEVIAKMDAGGAFRQRQEDGPLDLVIIGGGPAGLSAAVQAQERGLRYVLLERDKVAATIGSFPPGKKVYAEPYSLANRSRLEIDEDLEKGEFLQRIERLIQKYHLQIKEETEVTRVRKVADDHFAVETASGRSFPAKRVLVAIGRQGQPRLLQCPGADKTEKVTYRLHNPEDYTDKHILVVGGGNSAIETALLLMDHNQVTLSYRGDHLFRAKEENRRRIEQAEHDGKLTILYDSHVQEIGDHEVIVQVGQLRQTLPNDHVIAQLGTLPPVEFLMEMGLELDGIWNVRRLLLAILGLAVGVFVYFGAKNFVLTPEAAGEGKLLIPGLAWLVGSSLVGYAAFLGQVVLPVLWLVGLALRIISGNLAAWGQKPTVPVQQTRNWLIAGAVVYGLVLVAPSIFTLDAQQSGNGPYYVPGFGWLYQAIPTYFSNLYGLYYLFYFSAILVFGLYWAYRSGHKLIWRRNLTAILCQWTLWWGIPTFLVVFLGRNPWTPLLLRSLNAWPLNVSAFQLDPTVGPGDPAWWHTVAVVGVVWAAVLTFIIIPLVTIRWGKIYCSYICSCGALAETVGNSFRHRGPKGDFPRKLERWGFLFIVLASLATIAHLQGYSQFLSGYNLWVGTGLAGAVAIGLYPFLGQRLWCRLWCPLAFWMNFWGRWSKFQISAEKGKCIDCNVCNQYCQMGIDIKSRALRGQPVTLVDSPCVGCAECVVRCPMEILHLGEIPAKEPSPQPKLPVLGQS